QVQSDQCDNRTGHRRWHHSINNLAPSSFDDEANNNQAQARDQDGTSLRTNSASQQYGIGDQDGTSLRPNPVLLGCGQGRNKRERGPEIRRESIAGNQQE